MTLLLASLALAGPSPVVGGGPAPEGAWDDAAAVLSGDTFLCSGVLVHPRIVLTAGHCDHGIDRVVLGSTDLDAPAEVVDVAETHRHPDHLTTLDLAAVVLTRDAEVAPRDLARACFLDHAVPGAPVAVVGYGATDPWGTPGNTRLFQAFTTVDTAACDAPELGCNPSVMPDGEVVAGGDGVDSCTGDSGGPLYLLTDDGDVLLGVTSRGVAGGSTPCGDGGIYVRADAAVPWLEDVTGFRLPWPDCPDLPNRPPEPSPLTLAVVQGGAVTARLRPRDPDPTDAHTFALASYPERGQATVAPDGAVTYVAEPTFLGRVDFAITVTDDGTPPHAVDVPVTVDVGEHEGAALVASGCATSPAPAAAWWALLLPLARRRYRPVST